MRVCEGSLKTAARVEQRSGCWAVCGGGQCVEVASLKDTGGEGERERERGDTGA